MLKVKIHFFFSIIISWFKIHLPKRPDFNLLTTGDAASSLTEVLEHPTSVSVAIFAVEIGYNERIATTNVIIIKSFTKLSKLTVNQG